MICYYLAKKHCGLCKLIRPQVKQIVQQTNAIMIDMDADSGHLPQDLKKTIEEAGIVSLPVVIVTSNLEKKVFGKTDSGKIDLKALRDYMREGGRK